MTIHSIIIIIVIIIQREPRDGDRKKSAKWIATILHLVFCYVQKWLTYNQFILKIVAKERKTQHVTLPTTTMKTKKKQLERNTRNIQVEPKTKERISSEEQIPKFSDSKKQATNTHNTIVVCGIIRGDGIVGVVVYRGEKKNCCCYCCWCCCSPVVKRYMLPALIIFGTSNAKDKRKIPIVIEFMMNIHYALKLFNVD